MTPVPVALTIAGSDSGGGAGIQADLRTMHAFGVYGTTAVTALTAQNTTGVQAVHSVPPDFVAAQIRSVLSDFPVRACKTGMLATREIIETVALALGEAAIGAFVFDPVMVATSGDRLLDGGAETVMRDALLPLATIVTPNLDEARILVGHAVEDEDSMRAAASALVARGARAALVKGGHLPGDVVLDVLLDQDGFRTWKRPRVVTSAGHGTGCTLSAAIAARLAFGDPLVSAVERALDFVKRALVNAPGLGSGHGPLNHLVSVDRHDPAT